MTGHPLLLAVLAADLLALFLVCGAALTAFRIVLHWRPASHDAAQLRLEARAETAHLAVAWAAGILFCATAALVYAITQILPGLVPGAMCGTGVLQAMQSAGPRMLIYRAVALTLLWVWRRLEKANHALPEGPLVPVNARLVLLALPAVGLAIHATWQAVLAIDLQQPVDCCAVIYDRFRTPDEARRTLGAGAPFWLALFGTGSVGTAAAGFWAWRRPFRRPHLLLGVLALGWLPVAAITLTRHLSAYHYGVLHHHCPWCLFLTEHHLAGFPIGMAWMVVALEAVGAPVLAMLGGGEPGAVAQALGRQSGFAARNILWAVLLFVVWSAAPALWWRLRFGTWLTV